MTKNKRIQHSIVQICFAALFFLCLICWLLPDDVLLWIDGEAPMFLTVKFWFAGWIVGMLLMGLFWLIWMILMYGRIHELKTMQALSVELSQSITLFFGRNYQVLFQDQADDSEKILSKAAEIIRFNRLYKQ